MRKLLTGFEVFVTTLVAGVVGIVFVMFTTPAFAATFGALAGIAVVRLRRKYLAALEARMDNAGVEWDVQVNEVKVGTYSDANYARLRMEVFTDHRVYIAQLANLGWCASKILDSLFVGLPVSFFWVVVLSVVVVPDQAIDVLRQLQTLTPAQIVVGVQSVLWIVPVIAFLYVFVSVMATGAKFGFVNRFAERCDESLRRIKGVPTVGRMSLMRYEDGKFVFNDEAAHVFRTHS
jgi:hypothetical protein